MHVRSQNQINDADNFIITAETCAQVTTANLDLFLDQNYDHNIASTIECDTLITHDNKNIINAISNEPHKFGFCPLNPLESYKGEPVHWDVCHTDLEAHSLVTATGKPNFLAGRILVASQLNISNWCLHLSDYWDVQLPDLLEYGFPWMLIEVPYSHLQKLIMLQLCKILNMSSLTLRKNCLSRQC